MKELKIVLPVYYTHYYKKPKTVKRKVKDVYKYKTITERTFLVNTNWFRNENPFTIDKVKQHYHELVLKALQGSKVKFEGKYSTEYKYCYKSSVSDASNVIAIVEKFSLDGLIEHGALKEDNVKAHTNSNGWSVEEDKANPRLEIIIKEI